mgnify:CR=1 FL=1
MLNSYVTKMLIFKSCAYDNIFIINYMGFDQNVFYKLNFILIHNYVNY